MNNPNNDASMSGSRGPAPVAFHQDDARGVILNCLAGYDFRDVRDSLRKLGILPAFRPGAPASHPQPVDVQLSPEDIRKRQIARHIFDRAFPSLQASPAQLYLQVRGIWEPAQRTPMRYARTCHPQTREEEVPCIVIPRHNVRMGAIEGCLGIVTDGFAMLHAPTDCLALAEGMESALSAAILYSRPASARCGGFPAEMDLPARVKDVLVCADHDEPMKLGKPRVTSRQRAEKLAASIIKSGRRCEIVMPPQPGWDANDQLLAAG